MKKLTRFIMIFMVIFMTSSSVASAATYFTNNKNLDGIFKKMKEEFLKYPKDELLPITGDGWVIIGDPKVTPKPRKSKKISDKLLPAAAEKKLNDIKAIMEIKEEELGGFTQKDCKLITEHFTSKLLLAKDSDYGWGYDEKVHLYLGVNMDDLCEVKGLTGKLAKMGKAKDQVDAADLKVSSKITKYLNQSIQRGNKVSKEILNKLPGEVEKLFIEKNVSKIVAARTLSRIHSFIYAPYSEYQSDFKYEYDGTVSIESIIEDYEIEIRWQQEDREKEKKLEYFEYSNDKPTSKNIERITNYILDEELSEYFKSGFNKAITLDELARLYFDSKELDEKIVIEGNIISTNSPDYIKNAFIYGMIDNESDIKKPLTRLEVARVLINSAIYEDYWDSLNVVDYLKIPIDDLVTVASCIKGGMKTRVDKFEPQSKYTREEAIIDRVMFKFNNLRGYNIPFNLSEPSKIIVGKNTINLLFEDNNEIKAYIEDYLDDTVLGNIKLNKKYTKIDTGGVLIELFTPEKGIKFTIKKGVKYIDFEENYYGPRLSYKIEPKVVKDNEKVVMNMQLDTINKKLNSKLDAILKKIIKPKMTEEQKVKAIHDFVVKHITYDIKYQSSNSFEKVIETIDKGRGVCGDYTMLFKRLCERASIPCVYESSYTMVHAWNAVYLNGKWLFVDTTWDDDDSGKIKYNYYLKDRNTFMKSHTPFMGTPNIDVYTDIDSMNIKSQDELRGYLLQNIYYVDGFKLTFRMADKKTSPFIGYLRDPDVSFVLKYDSKKDIYTVTAKAKK